MGGSLAHLGKWSDSLKKLSPKRGWVENKTMQSPGSCGRIEEIGCSSSLLHLAWGRRQKGEGEAFREMSLQRM